MIGKFLKVCGGGIISVDHFYSVQFRWRYLEMWIERHAVGQANLMRDVEGPPALVWHRANQPSQY